MNRQTFLDSFGYMADAPDGVDTLRRLVLDLAVRGRLTRQDPDDEPATELLKGSKLDRDRQVAAKVVRKFSLVPEPLTVSDANRLPSGWAPVLLGALGAWGSGATPNRSTSAYYGGQIPWLKSGELNDGYVSSSEETITELALQETSVKLRRPGDVLIAMYGATIGRTAILDFEATTNQAVCACRPYEGIYNRFLHLLLMSMRGSFIGQGAGGAQPNISKEKIEAQVVSLPPHAEQVRIVERVDELMALCAELEDQQGARVEARSALTAATLHRVTGADTADDLRAAIKSFTERIGLHLAPEGGDLAALKRLRQTILDLAVRGRLTHQDPTDEPASEFLAQIASERDLLVKAKKIRKAKKFAPAEPVEGSADLPAGWAWARANEFFITSDSGWSPQCLVEPARPGEWGVLKTSAVSRGVFDEEANKKLPPGLEPRPQLEVRPGEFVMIRASGSKGLVGRGAIATETDSHLMLSDKHIRLAFLHEASTQYWAILNDATVVQSYYSDESSGTSTMSNVTRDRIGTLAVAVPPLAEQLRIVETVDALLALCDDLEHQLLAAQSLRGDLAASIAAHVAPVGA